MAKKKPNIGKALKKVAKKVNKEVIKPIDKAVVKPIDKAVVKPIDKAIVRPSVAAIDKGIIKPAGKALAPVKKKAKSKKEIDMQQTEITNLKYQLSTAENEKAFLLTQNNKMANTITTMNNEIGALNTRVNTLDNRINAPLVLAKEGFSSGKEGFPENPTPVNRDTPYINYDPRTSGLKALGNEYKKLYGDYYAGYQDGETMIEDVLKPQVDYLSATDLNGLEYSFVAVKQQNKTLASQIQETSEEYSTHFQKSKYVEDDVVSVKRRNAFLFFLFYGLLAIFAYAFLFEYAGQSDQSLIGQSEGQPSFTLYAKIGVIVAGLLYPYWIGYVSKLTSFLFNYSVALFRGTPYESSS